MTSQPTLILVAGGPGAGKTAFGRALAMGLSATILVDKDVLASPWIDPVLARLHDGQVDRDSDVYWTFVRPLEYASMMALALDNLALGKSAVVVAPFGRELRDGGWLDACRSEASRVAARLQVIWLDTSADVARDRMTRRADIRDRWKLEHWNEFAQTDPYAKPPGDALILHNAPDTRIEDLVDRALKWLGPQ